MFIKDAAARLALNADTIRMYLKGCEREWRNLAKSLRNAAKAYEEVDKGAAEAINPNEDRFFRDGGGGGFGGRGRRTLVSARCAGYAAAV